MKKLITSFNLQKSILKATTSIGSFNITGENGSMFDLEITNSSGNKYNFITKTFTSSDVVRTSSANCDSFNSSELAIQPANSGLIEGMYITGSGIDSETTVVGLKAIGNNDNNVVIMSKSHSIPNGASITFTAPINLKEIKISGGSYVNNVVFPTVGSNDSYNFKLLALHRYNTFLDNLEPAINTDPSSVNFGQFLTSGFRNNLVKEILLHQYVDTDVTVNMSSTDLTSLDVDFSANTFNISKPRNFISTSAIFSKTSFSFPITVPGTSAITKSRAPIVDYFETLKTHTVDGAVSNSKCIILDSVEHLLPGMVISAVSSGSLTANTTIQTINTEKKLIVITGNQTFADGITLTFKATGLNGPKAYGAEVSFKNLAIALTPLTVTVASSHNGASATVIPLVSAAGIKDGSTTLMKGVGVDVDSSDVSVTTRASGSNNITLSSARAIEAGTVLEVEGTSTSATITGDVFLTKMGDTDFTITLNTDNFVSIGVS